MKEGRRFSVVKKGKDGPCVGKGHANPPAQKLKLLRASDDGHKGLIDKKKEICVSAKRCPCEKMHSRRIGMKRRGGRGKEDASITTYNQKGDSWRFALAGASPSTP